MGHGCPLHPLPAQKYLLIFEAQAPELGEEEATICISKCRRNKLAGCCIPSILIKFVVRCKLLPKLHVHLLPKALMTTIGTLKRQGNQHAYIAMFFHSQQVSQAE
jgi:hypothetical protein